MQHETMFHTDRAAEMHLTLSRREIGQADVDLFEQRFHRQVGRPVKDHAQRAALIVFAQIGDRPLETGVRHGGHGDQEVAGEAT